MTPSTPPPPPPTHTRLTKVSGSVHMSYIRPTCITISVNFRVYAETESVEFKLMELIWNITHAN